MSLEEANHIVRFSLNYSPSGWYWVVDTRTPYGDIIGFKKYPEPNMAELALEGFLRYFTPKVLESGDSIRKYVEKHKPNKDENC